MKKEIILLSLITLNLSGHPQDYSPINPEWIYYYESTIAHQIFLKETKRNWTFKQNYIKGVRVDSIDYKNGSVIYYLQKELEWDESIPGCWEMFLIPCNGWLGSKILNTGTYYIFFNDNNDSIFIKSDAGLYENWIMYKSDSFTIMAEISKIDTISFLGVTDSAKFIGIKVYDNNQILLNIKTLQEPLILSQNYGFVKLYNFKFFPDSGIIKQKLFPHYIVGIPEKNLGISILTNEDVYNYEIGDELHYFTTKTYYSDEYRISTCTGKTITQDNDFIIFTFRNIRKYREPHYETISVNYSIITYPLLNLPVTGVSKLPLEATAKWGPYGPFLFYVFYNNYMNKLEIEYYDKIYEPPESVCPMWGRTIYIEGIGKLKKFVSWSPGSFSDASDYLLYYKIGDEEWGEPIFIDTGINNAKENCYTASPNPTDGEIYVIIDPGKIPRSISVISTSGRIVYQTSSNINTAEIINLRGNVPGIYYLIINYDNRVAREKIILIN